MKRALLLSHSPATPQDYISTILGTMGFVREWRCLPKGHILPDPDPHLYDLAVVYGGPQLLSDLKPGEEFLFDEISWTSRFVEAGGTYLGLCLGGQILAKAFGAEVKSHEKGHREIGFYPIHATQSGQIKANLPETMMVYHWHRDGFDLPAGSELLATGDIFPHQAFALGDRSLALQFHPEITDGMITQWSERAPADADQAPGAQHRTTHLDNYVQYQQQVRTWVKSQIDTLLSR